jgi:flagellar hook-length control protein FliK
VTAGLPQTALQPAEVPDAKLAPGEQDALLIAQGHAPWMSLVGQTAQLDGQGDADLRQGVATDFLSGRGHAAQLAHRQALQPGPGRRMPHSWARIFIQIRPKRIRRNRKQL